MSPLIDHRRKHRPSHSTATITRAPRPRWRRSPSPGWSTVLFLAPPTLERLQEFGAYRGIGIAGVARSAIRIWTGTAAGLGAAAHPRHAGRALQGLLDLRLCPPCRLHRAGRRRRGRTVRRLDPDDRSRPGNGSLPKLRPPVRTGARQGIPARPAPDHVEAPCHADG